MTWYFAAVLFLAVTLLAIAGVVIDRGLGPRWTWALFTGWGCAVIALVITAYLD
jgi:hypothetical protein